MAAELINRALKKYEELRDYPGHVRQAELKRVKVRSGDVVLLDISPDYIDVYISHKKYKDLPRAIHWTISRYEKLRTIATDYNLKIVEKGWYTFVLRRHTQTVAVCTSLGLLRCRTDWPQLLERLVREVYEARI